MGRCRLLVLVIVLLAWGAAACESEPPVPLVRSAAPAPAPVVPPAAAPVPVVTTAPAPPAPPATPLAALPDTAAAPLPAPPAVTAKPKKSRREKQPRFMRCGWPPTKRAGTRKLRLWNGKTREQVRECLGKPRKQEGTQWRYTRGHCATLIEDLVVVFGGDRVVRATATAKYNPNHCEL